MKGSEMAPARALLLALAACAATPAPAAARELHWSALVVDATLESDGTLAISERQDIVFTGDWNGGERTFRRFAGQRLTLERIVRIDPATGAEHELARGDLDAVDHWDWAGSSAVRWRSRLPEDPPFDSTPLSYRLDYRLTGALRKIGERAFRLDHDWAFADREGVIERIEVRLRLGDGWRALSPNRKSGARRTCRRDRGSSSRSTSRRRAPRSPLAPFRRAWRPRCVGRSSGSFSPESRIASPGSSGGIARSAVSAPAPRSRSTVPGSRSISSPCPPRSWAPPGTATSAAPRSRRCSRASPRRASSPRRCVPRRPGFSAATICTSVCSPTGIRSPTTSALSSTPCSATPTRPTRRACASATSRPASIRRRRSAPGSRGG